MIPSESKGTIELLMKVNCSHYCTCRRGGGEVVDVLHIAHS